LNNKNEEIDDEDLNDKPKLTPLQEMRIRIKGPDILKRKPRS